MRKVIVTGATGFLGRHTAERLVREGLQVTGLGRSLVHGPALERAGVRFVPADLSRRESLDKIFRDHDGVIHCAALSSPWGRYSDFYSANVLGTKNVLSAARASGVQRFVHVSTPSLYIDRTSRLDILESAPLPKAAINYYAATKRLAEGLVDEAVREGLSALTIRPQGIIGPGDSAIMPRMMRLARKKILPIIGDGDNWIDLTYVDNVVEALWLALNAPAHVVGRKYNITNGEPVRLYEMLERMFTDMGYKFKKKQISFRKAYWLAAGLEFASRTILTGKEPLLTRYSVCALGLSRTLNIDAARQDLGYSPVVDMTKAIGLVTKDLLEQR
jgi:nucleoside-diphosphate-sugar epimerase